MGLVGDVFNEGSSSSSPGRNAIGHVRYSTAGGSRSRNAQPFCATTDSGPLALAHNGNLVNACADPRELEGRGSIFSTTADSEVIVHLLARSREQLPEDRLIDALSQVKGAYSLVMLTDDALDGRARSARLPPARRSGGSTAASCSRARPARST